MPLNALGSVLPSSFFSRTVRARPANFVVKTACIRWLIYMRLPVNCSSASETEATSTWRKSASKAWSAGAAVVVVTGDCAWRSLFPHAIAQQTLIASTDATVVGDFTTAKNLFIRPPGCIYVRGL